MHWHQKLTYYTQEYHILITCQDTERYTKQYCQGWNTQNTIWTHNMTIRYMYIKKVVPAVQETGNAGVGCTGIGWGMGNTGKKS